MMTLYEKQEKRERNWLDKLMVGIVVILAGVVILLSFHSTKKLAAELGLNPYLAAGLVEVLFGSLLFLRGRQRATQRNVPPFLEWGYFGSLALVTAVNMWGLAQENPIIGPIVGVAISGGMWLMETCLVWLWTESHLPHQKTARELMREAKREIKEMETLQIIQWMRWEAQKPSLALIKKARKAEEKRKKVVGDGLPEYFTQHFTQQSKHVKEVIALPPAPIFAEVKRQIGFRTEPKPIPQPTSRFQPNIEAREKAIRIAKELQEQLGRIPTKGELMAHGLSEHYSKYAQGILKEEK